MSDRLSRTPVVSSALTGAVVSGVVIGGTAAAATSIRKVKKGLMTKEDAARNVAREAGTTGVAAGAAAMVVGGLGIGGLLGLVGVALVATGTKYMLDTAFKPEPVACLQPVEAEEKPEVKKAAPKKGAAKVKKAADRTGDADK